jgi:dipeptide transport system substrate-binding protein
MAIDKDSIVAAVYQGAGAPAKNPIPPTIWSYDDSIQAYSYDPEKAKAMLAEAGVTDLKTDLWYMPVQRPYNPDAKKMAELMQSDLAKVGITAELKTFEWGEYRKRLQAGEHMMGMLGWTGDNGDPDNFFATLFSCSAIGVSNYSSWCNQEFEDKIQAAKTTSDPAERTKLYEEAQVVFKKQAPWATLDHSLAIVPMRKNVEGFVQSPLGDFTFGTVDITE